MVNLLVRAERPADGFFHDKAMFKDERFFIRWVAPLVRRHVENPSHVATVILLVPIPLASAWSSVAQLPAHRSDRLRDRGPRNLVLEGKIGDGFPFCEPVGDVQLNFGLAPNLGDGHLDASRYGSSRSRADACFAGGFVGVLDPGGNAGAVCPFAIGTPWTTEPLPSVMLPAGCNWTL